MAKVLCVLYDDPVDGYPSTYARGGLPELDRYPDGQSLPAPSSVDFEPGQLLGSVSGELGLRSPDTPTSGPLSPLTEPAALSSAAERPATPRKVTDRRCSTL